VDDRKEGLRAQHRRDPCVRPRTKEAQDDFVPRYDRPGEHRHHHAVPVVERFERVSGIEVLSLRRSDRPPRSFAMSLSIYRISVPVLIRGLGVLSTYLDKAAAFATEKSIDPAVLVNARLAPTMLPLAGQVQRASDTSKGAIGRLTAIQVPSFSDTETTLDELKERIARTVEFLRSVRPEQMQDAEERSVELKFRTFTAKLRGDDYVLQFLLPNFFFHIATAHDILRHNGLDIGKTDYLGPFE
jgi:hypothetical protein